MGGVSDFGVELKSINRSSLVLDRRHRTRIRPSDSNEVIGNLLDLVTVAHPNLSIPGKVVEQWVGRRHLAKRAAVLTSLRAFNFSAQRIADQLHPVANSKNRNVNLE